MATDDDDLLWPALDDHRGPALPLDDAAARRMIDAALAPPEAKVTPLRPASRWLRWRVPLLVAAALAVTSAAAACIYAGLHAPAGPSPRPSAAPPASSAEDAPAPLPEVVDGPDASAASDAPGPSDEPVSSAAPRASGRAAPRPVDPGALLQRANELRAHKEWREAEAAYRLVLQIAPTSPEAQTARIAAADLRLHQLHDPGGAERLFGKAQEQGGALGEEAVYGLAETRRARGDREGESRALQQFLSAYPGSAMAARARARLAELSTR